MVEALKGPLAAERFRRGIEGMGGGRDATRLVAAGFDKPLSDLPRGPGYYALSDSKGYLAYAMLARLIGRDRMRAALRRITVERAYSTIDWPSFLKIIREESGQDIDWFLTQWFDRTGIPVLSHEWRQADGKVVVELTQQSPAFRLDLPVRFTFVDGSAETRTIDATQAKTVAAFGFDKPVNSVDVDPTYQVLHTTPAEVREATALQYATRGVLLWDNGQTEAAEKELAAGLASRREIDPSPAEFTERLYLGWIAQDAGRTQDAIAHERALSLPVRAPDLLARVYLNLARALTAQGHRDRAAAMARAAIATEEAAGSPTFISVRARKILLP